AAAPWSAGGTCRRPHPDRPPGREWPAAVRRGNATLSRTSHSPYGPASVTRGSRFRAQKAKSPLGAAARPYPVGGAPLAAIAVLACQRIWEQKFRICDRCGAAVQNI